MCGTKTCEKFHFLMRKGTKMALKPPSRLELFSRKKLAKILISFYNSY